MLLPAGILDQAIPFPASDRTIGLTGERLTAKAFREWLLEKGFEIDDV